MNEKIDIILAAFLLAYAPKQVIFDAAAELLEELSLNTVPLE